ncbi:hypothetical protein [Spirosoma litoris]
MKSLHTVFLVSLVFVFGQCSTTAKFPEGIDGKFEVRDNNKHCLHTGALDTGVQCLRVYANHNTRDKAFGLAKKYAVAAVMMRGISGSSVEKPLLTQQEQEKCAGFVQQFFDSGDYLKYIDQAEVEPNEVYKIQGGYRVAIDARVNYQRLGKYLTENGCKRKLAF